MKRWLLHILLVGVLGMLAASCSQVIDDPTDSGCEDAKEKVFIHFTIALDESKTASRSWNGYDTDDNVQNSNAELGTEYENQINSIHALLYDLNGVLMGKLNNVMVDVDDNSENKHVYTVVGSIEVDADNIADLDFKLMVLANCNLPANLNDINTHTFNNPRTTNGSGIPMWGIATYNDVDLAGCTSVGTAYDLKNTPVYLLRSMAKIEVTLSEDTKAAGYNLTGASLNKVMQTGIVMPKLKSADDADMTIATLSSTKELGIDEVFNPATDGTAEGDTFTGSDNTFYIYVPEYDNSERDLEISLSFEGESETKSFKHGSYSEGKFQSSSNVIRNHYYKYTVSIEDGLSLTLEAQPWALQSFSTSYENVINYSPVGWEENSIAQIKDEYVYMSAESEAAVFRFNVELPAGYEYTVYLSNPTDFNLEVLTEQDGTIQVKVSPIDTAAEYPQTALRAYVKSIDGKTTELKLTPEGASYDYYTIIQNW